MYIRGHHQPTCHTKRKFEIHSPPSSTLFLQTSPLGLTYPISNLRYLPPPTRTTPAPYLQPPCLLTVSRRQHPEPHPPLSTSIRQHHLPNKAILNSFNRLTPNPSYSLGKEIKLQAFQEIFLLSSLPLKKKKK